MPNKIMVVDDQEDIRYSVKLLLEKSGFEVVTAENADDCLKKLSSTKVDLILLDIMMPGMPVKELIEKVKGTKIAFLSAVRMSDDEKAELLRENIVAYIQKPPQNEKLVEQIKEIVTCR